MAELEALGDEGMRAYNLKSGAGEKLGVYRGYPCSKGCVSPFAPIAIRELARRR
jgi:hypothetical protein